MLKEFIPPSHAPPPPHAVPPSHSDPNGPGGPRPQQPGQPHVPTAQFGRAILFYRLLGDLMCGTG